MTLLIFMQDINMNKTKTTYKFSCFMLIKTKIKLINNKKNIIYYNRENFNHIIMNASINCFEVISN